MSEEYREMEDGVEESDYRNAEAEYEPKKGSGLAVTSLVLGILSLVGCMFIAGIPAIICGSIASKKAKRGEAEGGGLALAGIITGAIGSVMTILQVGILAAMLLPALSMARESARKISCANNLKQIGLALRMYSNVYDEQFPPYDGAKGLDLLRTEGFLDNPRVFVCPSSQTEPAAPGEPLTEEHCDYEYFGGHSEADPVDTVLARDKPENHDRFGNILFVDGHVKGYAGSDWQNPLGARP